MKLIRKDWRSDGVFGSIFDENGGHVCFTLEHAYVQADGSYAPKLAAGIYTCEKGVHALEDAVLFSAFEVLGVPDFMDKPVSGILIHIGNYNDDSKGCILIGQGLGRTSKGGVMLTSSKQAFDAFMFRQKFLTEFTLEVT